MSSAAVPWYRMRPPSSTYAVLASPSATCANCSISRIADPGARDLLERRHEALHDDRRQAQRELVDDHDPRPRDERLGEDDHLLLAAREQARRRLPARLELAGRARARSAIRALRSLARERVRRDAQVVLHRQLGQQPPPLGDDRDARGADRLGPRAREVRVAEQDLAAARAQDSADREHERRLAGAVRAEQRRDLARRDRRARRRGRPCARRARRRAPRAAARLRSRSRAHTSSSVPR